MGDSFETVTDRMGVVIEGVDAPLIFGMGMCRVSNSIDNGVSQSWVGMSIVNLSSE